MTMARVNNGNVTRVGLLDSLRGEAMETLHRRGWRVVKAMPKPNDGKRYEYTAPYSYDGDAVYGTWQEVDTDARDKALLQEKRNNATMTRMKFMLALEEAGLYDEAEEAVDSEKVSKAGKIMWRNASVFNRMDETLVQFATALGYTEAQLDALFGISR